MAIITRPDDLKSVVADLKKRIATLEKSRTATFNHLQNAQYSNYTSFTVNTSYQDGPNLASQYQPASSFVLFRPTRLIMFAVASVKITSGSGFAHAHAILRRLPSDPWTVSGQSPDAIIDSSANAYQSLIMYVGNAARPLSGASPPPPGDVYPAGTYQCMIQYYGESGVTQLSIGNQNIDVFSFGD